MTTTVLPDAAAARAPTIAAPTPVRPRHLLAAVLTVSVVSGLAFGLPALSPLVRVTLGVFALAVIAWTVLRWAETPVALAAALALVAAGAVSVDRFQRALGHELVWMLAGAFLLAAAIRDSGLAERCIRRALAGCRSMRGLVWRLTLLIAATAFVVPSTSGRAALLLPVFLALTQALGAPRLTRALALLFPSVIVLSAAASPLGAGAHLAALEFIAKLGLTPPSYGRWVLLAAPLALASCAVAAALVIHLFLSAEERAAAVTLPPADSAPSTRPQRWLALLTIATVAAWFTSPWHGASPALVTVGAALLATCRPLAGVSFKTALKGVEWNLILFLAATLVMGDALLASGAAQALANAAAESIPASLRAQPALLAAAVAALAMLSHLAITSRSARATVLIPALALPLAVSAEQAMSLVLLVTLASGYCQTLRVSAKPVALLATADRVDERDLIRLSLALMLPFLLLAVASAVLWWPALGVALDAAQVVIDPRE